MRIICILAFHLVQSFANRFWRIFICSFTYYSAISSGRYESLEGVKRSAKSCRHFLFNSVIMVHFIIHYSLFENTNNVFCSRCLLVCVHMSLHHICSSFLSLVDVVHIKPIFQKTEHGWVILTPWNCKHSSRTACDKRRVIFQCIKRRIKYCQVKIFQFTKFVGRLWYHSTSDEQ